MSLRDLLQVNDGPYAVALHIGCGAEPAKLWGDAARAVIAVEPDPYAAISARDSLARYADPSRVLEGAIAVETGRISFIRCNLSLLSGWREPTGALELFPGLKELERVSVECWSVLGMMEATGVRHISGRKALLIEAPSETLKILSELEKSGDLVQFDTVVSIAPGVELHAGGGDRAALEAWASERNLRLVSELDPEDPDLPYVRIEIDYKADCATKSKRIVELESLLKTAREDALRHSTAWEAAQTEAAKASTLAERVDALQARCSDVQRRSESWRKKAQRAEAKLEKAAQFEADARRLHDENQNLLAKRAELEQA
ncbi:hypothetical protein, partial [Hyphobacterium vulgare]